MKYLISEENSTVTINIFDNKTKNIEDKVKQFLEVWKNKYLDKIYFNFLIDSTKVTTPDVKDCYKVIKFIRKIKKSNIQYLKYSIITINSLTIKNLLFYMFKIQPPVAPIYIVKNIKEAQELNNIIYCDGIDSILFETFCTVNDVLYVSNSISNKTVKNTVEAIHIIDDSVNSLNNLIKENES
ncbi:MAG: hypothetical protein CMF80_07860 [Candidatus Marinimicrobia bacterium]|nr:hypothetical protein [Candidatus Neomarinimicrobiota bacterium]|tara:strand:+ start:34 stop:582 length:549 start_codon:yes stop_codon:yes gene_type:complete